MPSSSPSLKTLFLRIPGNYSWIFLFIAFFVWVWSAINPIDFETWLIEQAATLIGVATLLWLARSVDFDRSSYLALLVLFCLHTVGTHYTYSLTPYDQWSVHLLGSSPNEWFDWERNHYDRLVHFCYGLLTASPMDQALQQRLLLSPGAAKFITLNIVLSTSALYELAEWAAAITIGGDVGAAYLGTQGDVWDAQTDIALAGAGWLLQFSLRGICSALKFNRGFP